MKDLTSMKDLTLSLSKGVPHAPVCRICFPRHLALGKRPWWF